MSSNRWIPLPSSAPSPPVGYTPADENIVLGEGKQIIAVTVVVRSRNEKADEERLELISQFQSQLPKERTYLSHQEFEKRFGSDPDDLGKVSTWFENNGLPGAETNPEGRTVFLTGERQKFCDAFKVKPIAYINQASGERILSFVGPLQVPEELGGGKRPVIEAVLGLEFTAPLTHNAYVRIPKGLPHTTPTEKDEVIRDASMASDPRTIMTERYQVPPEQDAAGECVAIIMLGRGGYHQRDMKEYFSGDAEPPKITDVCLGGAKNDPADFKEIQEFLDEYDFVPVEPGAVLPQAPESAFPIITGTIEATLDVQLVCSFARGVHAVSYFAPDTFEGQYRAITTAITDKINDPSAMSCSWSDYENMSDEVGVAQSRLEDVVFQDAVIKGITICFAAGNGGDGTVREGIKEPTAQFPPTSPHVLACGGTMVPIVGRSAQEGQLSVWYEYTQMEIGISGGGVSKIFTELPEWQGPEKDFKAKTNGRVGRGVPDVAGKADMATGYSMLVGGRSIAMGGTSSVAPLWAGLVAMLNKELGVRTGHLNPLLYRKEFADCFNKVQQGMNGAYVVHEAWNACTGLGTPLWPKLVTALKGSESG